MSEQDNPLNSVGDGGRDKQGKFRKGNRCAAGNPLARRVQQWRRALARAVTQEDLTAVVHKLVESAKLGEPWAVRELLGRCLGQPDQKLLLEADILLPQTAVLVEDDDWYGNADRLKAAAAARADPQTSQVQPGAGVDYRAGASGNGNGTG